MQDLHQLPTWLIAVCLVVLAVLVSATLFALAKVFLKVAIILTALLVVGLGGYVGSFLLLTTATVHADGSVTRQFPCVSAMQFYLPMRIYDRLGHDGSVRWTPPVT